ASTHARPLSPLPAISTRALSLTLAPAPFLAISLPCARALSLPRAKDPLNRQAQLVLEGRFPSSRAGPAHVPRRRPGSPCPGFPYWVTLSWKAPSPGPSKRRTPHDTPPQRGEPGPVALRVQQGNIPQTAAAAVIVTLFEGVTQPGGATGALDARIGGLIRRLIAAGEFKGRLNETAVLHVGEGFPFRKVVVVGLGKSSEFDAERVRQVSATAAQTAAKGNVKTIATIVHGAGIGGLDVFTAAQSVAEGTLLGLY